MITFRREPNNKYDPNAIRVENTVREQVGHVKREQAFALSKVLDTIPSARAEGVIAETPSYYSVALKLAVYAPPGISTLVLNTLVNRGLHPLKQITPGRLMEEKGTSKGGGGGARSGLGANLNMERVLQDLENKNTAFEQLYLGVPIEEMPRLAAPSTVKTKLLPYATRKFNS